MTKADELRHEARRILSGGILDLDVLMDAADAMDLMAEALDAAEEILRYSPHISTNVNGTRRNMSTRAALDEVSAALIAAGREVK